MLTCLVLLPFHVAGTSWKPHNCHNYSNVHLTMLRAQRQKARARNINKHSKMFLPAQLLLIWGVNTCTGKSPPHDINLLNNDPPVLPSKLSPVLGNQKLHNHHRPSRPTARVLNTKQGAASKPIALCLPQLKSAWTNTPNQHKHKQACYPVI